MTTILPKLDPNQNYTMQLPNGETITITTSKPDNGLFNTYIDHRAHNGLSLSALHCPWSRPYQDGLYIAKTDYLSSAACDQWNFDKLYTNWVKDDMKIGCTYSFYEYYSPDNGEDYTKGVEDIVSSLDNYTCFKVVNGVLV